jgi:hypothetical protein
MNLIGESFDDYVKTQVNQRQIYYGSTSGNDPNFIKKRTEYLYNKEPMVKLVSSVDITEDKLKQLGFDTNDQKRLAGANLAKEFVLFAGASQYGGINQNSSSNITGSDIFNLRAGLNKSQSNVNLGSSAYGLGGIEFGQVPMPGITGISVSYKNRGSLKTATITAKAYNRTQLNVIDALYLRLGYTVLLEWGWGVNYLNNSGEVIPQMRRTLTNGFLNGSFNSFNILDSISNGKKTFSGNYDAMYGKITNFNWSFNPDGSYDITINLVSIGDIIESLTINDLQGGGGVVLNSEDFQDILDDVSSQIRLLTKSLTSNTININGKDILVKTEALTFSEAGDRNSTTINIITDPDTNKPLNTEENIRDFVTRKTGLVSATPITGSNIGILTSNAGLNSLTYHLYKNIKLEVDARGVDVTNRVRVLKETSSVYAARINWNGGSEPNYYIKFGSLLSYIESNLIYQNQKTQTSTSGIPAIKFDRLYNDNLIYINKYSVAADFSKVVTLNKNFPRLPFENPTINLLEGLPQFISNESENAGYLMNVFLNIDWLAETMKSNVDEDGNISLYSVLTAICQGINSSLGNVNNLDVTVDEDTNQIRFIDDKPIPDILSKFFKDDIPTEFQVYSFSSNSATDLRNLRGSFVQDFSIKTEVSNKLATTLSIGAQALNAVVTSNATAFQSWNEGLTDRISPVKQMNNEDKTKSATEKYADDIKNFIKLLDKYDAKTLSTEELPQLITLNKTWQKYIEARTAEIAQKASPTSVGFIPINLNLTMDGLSGMKIYQTFTIDSKFLPLNYPEKLKFLIKKVSHTVSSNGWQTQIESLSIPKDITKSSSNITTNASSSSTPPPIIDKPLIVVDDEEKNQLKATAPFIYPIYNGVLRGSDANGSGAYGAKRGNRQHFGIDLITPTNKTITLYAPISGKISVGSPYGIPKLTNSGWNVDQGFTIYGQGGTEYEGYVVQVFYSVLNVKAGTLVNIGDPVAYTIYDMYSAYAKTEGTKGMTNHVHYQVKYNGKPVDPSFLIKGDNSLYKLVTDPNTKIISPAEKRRLAGLVKKP